MVNKFHTIIRKSLPSLLLASMGSGFATAQVTIQSAAIESGLISPRTFFHATLFNLGASCKATLEGELITRSGDPVLHFSTEPFTVPAGARTVTASELALQSFQYGSGPAGRAAQRFQRLPGGEYHYCIRLHAPQAESGDEFCERISVEDLLFLDLVQPWDGDTIEETRPALTWMMAGPGPSLATADIRLVLVPLGTGRTPAQALAAERPLFMLPHVKERTLPYPAGMADLEPGKCYAWQVEQLDGARVVDRSDAWGFCVRKHREPVPNKYVHIGHTEPGSVYEASDGRIYFRYDEAYASKKLDCTIKDERNRQINPEVNTDGQDVAPGTRSVGVNVYELDLSPYNLRSGYYELVVRDEKLRSYSLKFHVAR